MSGKYAMVLPLLFLGGCSFLDPTRATVDFNALSSDMFVTGHTEESGGAGNAQLSASISGPKASAKLYVEARKIAGQWHYDAMIVQLENGKQVDLQQAQALPPPN